ncbi:MAG: uroporphyrinogen-III synthase [Alsobacter sp.]
MRVLVTRAERDAARTAAALRGLGHEPVLSPVLAIRATGAPLPDGAFEAVLATSASAFPPVVAPWPEPLRGLPLFAVGEATAAAARQSGHRDVRQGPGRAEDLAGALPPWPAGTRLLYLAGRDRGPQLEEAAAARGFSVAAVDVYAAEAAATLSPEALSAITGPGPLAVLHYSARSAAIFLRLALAAGLREGLLRARHLCLSSAVAEPLAAAGCAVSVATKPQEEALMRLLAQA